MKFKLLAPHYIDDQMLQAGTEIGDGTPYPFTWPAGHPKLKGYRPPTDQMEGLDDEAKAAIEKLGEINSADPFRTVLEPEAPAVSKTASK